MTKTHKRGTHMLPRDECNPRPPQLHRTILCSRTEILGHGAAASGSSSERATSTSAELSQDQTLHCRSLPRGADEIHRVGDLHETSKRPYATPPPAWT